MTDSFVLVVNPHAGAGRAARRVPQLTALLRGEGARFELRETRGPGDATLLVRAALREGASGIAVVGGDGTLNEAVNGFFDESGSPINPDAWLGPLSCGTGGDFRKTLGTPDAGAGGRGLGRVVATMLASRPRPIDLGWLDMVSNEGAPLRRAFLNVASFGVGGLVDRLVNDAPKWMGGKPAFFMGTLRALARYRNQRVWVRIDGGSERETSIVNIAIANGRFFGGGMMIAPEARIDDGVFDVIGMEMPVIETVRMTLSLYQGKHLAQPGVTFTRGRVVEARPVDPNAHVLLDVDGEAPGRLPATFTIKPGALRLRG